MKERNKQVKGQQTLSFAPPKQVTLDVQDVEPQRKCFSHDARCETMAMLVAFLHMCGNMSEGPCFHVIDGVSSALLIFAFEFVSCPCVVFPKVYVGCSQEKPISTPKRKTATVETEDAASSGKKWLGLQVCLRNAWRLQFWFF